MSSEAAIGEALSRFMRGAFDDAVQLRFVKSVDRDETKMLLTTQNYVQRHISGLTLSQLDRHQIANVFEAWVLTDLRTLAFHLEDVVRKIREVTGD